MLGLGAGWSAVLGAGGRPAKLAELSAGIDELRTLFSGEEAELYGTRVRLAAARRQVPIYLAASQRGMLRLTGRKADGVILMGAADPGFCRWQLGFLEEGLAEAGRDRSEVTVDLVVTMSIDPDEDRALADVRAWATSQAATFHPWKRLPAGWERFRPEFERAAAAYDLIDHLSLHAEHKEAVSDEFVRSVAVTGDLETCVDRLKELVELDVDRVTFALLSGGRVRRLEELATSVIPRLTGSPA
jgi:5,10-methylenetetrahydromethanopterin reductase